MEILCYDCGQPIKKSEMSKEHIPAQCLFAGYGDKYKENRITVPAHQSCNHSYSDIDQELRDVIGITTDNMTDKKELVSKSLRSIFSKKQNNERFSSDSGVLYVDFNYEALRELHIKNFKGLFYHKFHIPLPEKFKIEIITEEDQDLFTLGQIKDLYHTINDTFPQWEKSGHKDIFKYKVIVFDNNGFCEFDITSNEQSVLILMVYNEEIRCFTIATSIHIINQLSPKV